jgi:hypothetical protein
MIALLRSRDTAALVAVDRIEDTDDFGGVDLVNLGPSSCLVYEIQYVLDFSDPNYTRDPIDAIVPGKPHLVGPGDSYRVLDEKVFGSVREARSGDWTTAGLGELTIHVRYVPGQDRVMSASLMIDAKPDSFALKLLPADRRTPAGVAV